MLFMRNGKWISTACRSWGRQVASFMLVSLPIMFSNWLLRKLLLACNIQYLCMFVLLCSNKQFIDRTSLFFLVEHKGSTLQKLKSNIRYDLEPVPSISHVSYFPSVSFTNMCMLLPSISALSIYISAAWYYSYSTTNKMHLFLKLFILVKRSTCFRRSFHPSSGAQNCTYSNRYMSNKQLLLPAANSSCSTYTVAVCAILSSWRWTERPSETCRAFYKNK